MYNFYVREYSLNLSAINLQKSDSRLCIYNLFYPPKRLVYHIFFIFHLILHLQPFKFNIY